MNVENILSELKKYDLAAIKNHLKHLEDLINLKADKVELGPIKDDINNINELLKKLQADILALKSASGGSGGSVSGDMLVEITNRIDKIELRLDGLDKKIAGLSKQGNSNIQIHAGDLSAVDSRLHDLENRFNNHLINYEDFKNEIYKLL